jgi:hypothetical protein
MKTIKILSAFIAVAAAASFGDWGDYGETTSDCNKNSNCIWELCGKSGCNTIRSGGHWFGYDDSKETPTNVFEGALKNEGLGGCTKNNFPGREDETESDIVSEPWAAEGGCVKFKYNENGDMIGSNLAGDPVTCTYAWPFSGVGFNWKDANPSGPNGGRVPAPDVIAGKQGVKVWYWIKPHADATTDGTNKLFVEFATCDAGFNSSGTYSGEDKGCGNNVATVTASNEFMHSMTNIDDIEDCWRKGCDFFFEDFTQEKGWGTQHAAGIAGTEILKNSNVGLKFKWSGFSKGDVKDKTKPGDEAGVKPATGTYFAELCIRRVSWTGDNYEFSGDSPGNPTPTIKANVKSALQMGLVGKTFTLNGLNSHATLEIINVHGVLVSKENVGPSNKSVNVSNLKSGVYIVRVKGENVNFMQKVMVK